MTDFTEFVKLLTAMVSLLTALVGLSKALKQGSKPKRRYEKAIGGRLPRGAASFRGLGVPQWALSIGPCGSPYRTCGEEASHAPCYLH
ncbi:hypothetical protein, partial [Collinsella aerofaciens]|uniref:hypothetical protein n=1 Tax=Collinsella aerofaciens TaxID=74426 RepID=UPI00232EFBDC